MTLFVCDYCKYEFESSEEEITQCPDCGKYKVRHATQKEEEDYNRRKDEDVWK